MQGQSNPLQVSVQALLNLCSGQDQQDQASDLGLQDRASGLGLQDQASGQDPPDPESDLGQRDQVSNPRRAQRKYLAKLSTVTHMTGIPSC